MLCKTCNNILRKTVTAGKGKWVCTACGKDDALSGRDTLMHEEIKIRQGIPVSGFTIFHYPANPLERADCPKCKAQIVRWITDSSHTKVYGCSCGYSWHNGTAEEVVASAAASSEGKRETKAEVKLESKRETKPEKKRS